MNFEFDKSLEILSRTPSILKATLGDLDPFWTDYQDGHGRWSPREIVGHFVHGEIEDWIPRIRIILFEDNKNFEPFDPGDFEHFIKDKDVNELLNDFESKRTNSLNELASFNLQPKDFEKKGLHPEFGEVTLQQLIATWTVHDLNHLYQISRTIAKKYEADIGPWKSYLRIARD